MSALDGLPDDFRDLLVELADTNAEFVLIDGWAMSVHGRTRATEDIDVLVRPSAENARRVFEALVAFGTPLSLELEDRRVRVIGRDALLTNKRAAARLKDLASSG